MRALVALQSLSLRQVNEAMSERITRQAMKALRAGRKADAVVLLEQAAADDPVAANQLGAMFEHGEHVAQDDARARELYRHAADKGFALAQFNLGFLLHMGRGGDADRERARHWYGKAADQGEPTALLNLGILLARGEGGPRDVAAGYALWERAAQAGEPMAAFNLGMVHAGGHDVPVDFVKALAWFRRAYTMGHPQAVAECAKVRGVMTAEEIAAADALASHDKAQREALS